MSPEADLSLRVEHELFLRSFFTARPPELMVRQLSTALKDVFVPAGTLLYERGRPAELLYFVISGEVALEAPDVEPWVLKDLSLLGVLDGSQGRPYTRTARALTDVAALTMAFRDYVDLMEDHFDFTKLTIESNSRDLHDRCLALAPDQVFAPPAPREAMVHGDRPLELLERLLVLRHSEFLERAPIQALVSLAKHSESERWASGAVLAQEGEPAPHLRLVAAGLLEATRSKPVVKATFGPGALLLGCASVGYLDQQYTVQATNEALTLRILKEDFFDIMEDHFPLAGSTFAYFARENERVRNRLAEQARVPPPPAP